MVKQIFFLGGGDKQDASEPPLQNSMIVKSPIILRILKLQDVALPRPKTYFLKRSFKYRGMTMLWNNLSNQAKTVQLLSEFKSKLALCLLLDRSDFLIYMCIFENL